MHFTVIKDAKDIHGFHLKKLWFVLFPSPSWIFDKFSNFLSHTENSRPKFWINQNRWNFTEKFHATSSKWFCEKKIWLTSVSICNDCMKLWKPGTKSDCDPTVSMGQELLSNLSFKIQSAKNWNLGSSKWLCWTPFCSTHVNARILILTQRAQILYMVELAIDVYQF